MILSNGSITVFVMHTVFTTLHETVYNAEGIRLNSPSFSMSLFIPSVVYETFLPNISVMSMFFFNVREEKASIYLFLKQ